MDEKKPLALRLLDSPLKVVIVIFSVLSVGLYGALIDSKSIRNDELKELRIENERMRAELSKLRDQDILSKSGCTGHPTKEEWESMKKDLDQLVAKKQCPRSK